MIVVLPDSKTIYNGSMYSSSATTGDSENYMSRTMWWPTSTRTTAPYPIRAEQRIGQATQWAGYGASRIGMKHSRCVRSALHHEPAAACRPWEAAGPCPADRMKEMVIANERESLPRPSRPPNLAAAIAGLSAPRIFATAAAWAPDPKNPPLYFDLPTKDGAARAGDTWRNMHCQLHHWHLCPPAHRQSQGSTAPSRSTWAIRTALRFDATKLHGILDNYGIANRFRDLFGYTYVKRRSRSLPESHVMPFFSKNLCFTAGLPLAGPNL
jgi:hypothetical protein